MSPKVTVLMPVFNGEKYILEAIDSILNQTFSEFEFIIIDDGSEDGTLSLVKACARQDRRIYLHIQKTNQGISNCLNLGLKLANSSLIVRMDADDFAYPQRIAKLMEFLNSHPEVDICGSAVEIYDEPNSIWVPPASHDAIKVKLLFESCLYHPSVAFKKETILSVGGYQPSMTGAEDYDLWQRLSTCPNVYFANITEPLLRYRTHKEPNRYDYKEKQTNLADRVRKNSISNLGLENEDVSGSCHIAFVEPSRANLIPPLKVCQSWLEEICKTNDHLLVFSKVHLQRELEMRWRNLCLYVSKSRPGTVFEYLNNSNSVKLSERIYQSMRMIWRSCRYWLN